MLTTNASKTKKKVLPNINVLSENGIIFVSEGLFFKIKKTFFSQKMCFLKRLLNMRKYIKSQVSIVWYSIFI